MIKRLCPGEVWQPKLGAPPGNRNARKHGLRSGALIAWRKRKEDWRRRVKAALQAAEAASLAGEAASQQYCSRSTNLTGNVS